MITEPWVNVTHNWGTRIDVVPAYDLRPHDLGSSCWCKPRVSEQHSMVLVHISMDGREAFETGERLAS